MCVPTYININQNSFGIVMVVLTKANTYLLTPVQSPS